MYNAFLLLHLLINEIQQILKVWQYYNNRYNFAHSFLTTNLSMHLLSRLKNSSVSFLGSTLAFTHSPPSFPPCLVSLGGSTRVRLHWTPMVLLAFFSPGLSTIFWGCPEPQVKRCFGFSCFLLLLSLMSWSELFATVWSILQLLRGSLLVDHSISSGPHWYTSE